MKNYFVYPSLLLLFVLGCTNSELDSLEEELQTNAKHTTSVFAKLMEDPAFAERIKSYTTTKSSARSGGKGVFFLMYNFPGFNAMFNFTPDGKIIVVYADNLEKAFNIEAMSKDRVRFSINLNKANVEVNDASTFEFLYSNICMDNKIANYNLSFIAPSTTNFEGIYETDFSNGESAVGLAMHGIVDDGASFTGPPGEEELHCANPTTVKSIKISN